MGKNPIDIYGLASQEELSSYNIQYPCKEICKSYDVTLSESKPNIELILKVFLKSEITQWKIVKTHNSNKLFIEVLLNVRVLFTKDLYSKNIYSTEFNKTFSELLPIPNTSINNLKPRIFIEEAFINQLNKKRFSLSTLILLCTTSDSNTDIKDINKLENINPHLEKNKENSININVEYDMQSNESI